jgi:hypothetical protein
MELVCSYDNEAMVRNCVEISLQNLCASILFKKPEPLFDMMKDDMLRNSDTETKERKLNSK